jgi:hypothetical protein
VADVAEAFNTEGRSLRFFIHSYPIAHFEDVLSGC